MKEAKLQSSVTAWFRRGGGKEWLRRRAGVPRNAGWAVCAALELKVDRGKGRIPFSEVVGEKRIHQVHEAYRAKHGLLSHKIDDSGVGYKPLDMVVLSGAVAGYVMGFEGEAVRKAGLGNRGAWFVDIDVVVAEGCVDGDIKKGGRKGGSFTLEWVAGIGERLEIT
jgi:hypothetical protein